MLLEAGPSSTQALVTIYFRAEELLMRYLYRRSSDSCNEYLLSMWHSKAARGAFEFRVFLEANKWCCLWVQAGTWDAGRSKGPCGKTMQKGCPCTCVCSMKFLPMTLVDRVIGPF